MTRFGRTCADRTRWIPLTWVAVMAVSGGLAGGCEREPTPEPSSDALPCDVAELLDTRCGSCHGSSPQFGAPMPLTSWGELTASRNGSRTYDLILRRVADDARPMPPAPNARLTARERATLQNWVNQGTPRAARGAACSSSPRPQEPIASSESPSDCTDFYELTAHGGSGASDPSPHRVSANPINDDNEYRCFYFKPPYQGGSEGLWFEPIVDNSKVLHHWLLYGRDNMIERDGTVKPCSASEPGAYLLAGWAPGAETRVMPPDVGMQMPSGGSAGLILEVHYYNPTGQAQSDRSGVRFCTAPRNVRRHSAGVHFTGSEGICVRPFGQQQVSGMCDPPDTQDIHIIDIWPHMHQIGRHMKMTLLRANGAREVIHDRPFDFNSQIGYPTNVVMRPGDRLETVCSFENNTGSRVPFGEQTQEEMCYGFVTAWPVGALQMNTGVAGLLQPARRCMNGLSILQSCNGLADYPAAL